MKWGQLQRLGVAYLSITDVRSHYNLYLVDSIEENMNKLELEADRAEVKKAMEEQRNSIPTEEELEALDRMLNDPLPDGDATTPRVPRGIPRAPGKYVAN